jgi:hypothetical protein
VIDNIAESAMRVPCHPHGTHVWRLHSALIRPWESCWKDDACAGKAGRWVYDFDAKDGVNLSACGTPMVNDLVSSEVLTISCLGMAAYKVPNGHDSSGSSNTGGRIPTVVHPEHVRGRHRLNHARICGWS